MSTAHRRMVGITTVALVPLLFVVMATWSGGGDVEVSTDDEDAVDEDALDEAGLRPDPAAPSRGIGLLAPTDGVASRLLPVTVEPSTRLTDRQVVRISGSGFTPRAMLGAVLCSAGAAGGGGVAFCELAHYDNFQASSEGTFVDDYVLRRFIVTPADGTVDCLEATDRCLLAVGNTSDYDESGGSFISFEGAADPPPPQLVVSPSDGLVDGQVVSIKGTGIRAAPDAWLRQCPSDQVTLEACTPLVAQLDGPAVGGQLSVTAPLSRSLRVGEGQVDCAAAPGCVLATTEYAGRSAVVPIGFAATSEPPAAAPPTTLPAGPPAAEPPTSVPPEPVPAPVPTTTQPPEGIGARGALGDLELRLELDDTTLAPGGTTGGHLVISNPTSQPIVDPSCALSTFDVGLVPADQPDAPLTGTVEGACDPGSLFPPGVTVRADTSADITARGSGGVPLEPGSYVAVVHHRHGIAPLSVPVTVTAGP